MPNFIRYIKCKVINFLRYVAQIARFCRRCTPPRRGGVGPERRARAERRRGEGTLPYRGDPGARRERDSDRLRRRNLHGFDHRGALRGGLFAGGDACDRRFGAGSGVGFGAHRFALRLLLPPDAGSALDAYAAAQSARRGEAQRCQEQVAASAAEPSHFVVADRSGARRTADAGFDGLRRRFRPAHGAVPVRGQRPGGAQTLCAQNGRPGRSGACFDGHSAGVQPDREGFDAALRRRYLRQFSVETPRRNLPSRLPDRQQMHVGQHRTQRQKHHGPGVDAHHGEDRLRHAGRPQHAYRAGGRRFDARLFSGRRHYPVGL